IHHGYHHFAQDRKYYWKLFQETKLPTLLFLKPLLLRVERILQLYHHDIWKQVREKVPALYGLFGTIWTTVVVNSGSSTWHIDPEDQGLTALLYFGNFSEEQLNLGHPVNIRIPVQNMDLIFLNSSSIYHSSLLFTGTRLNLGFYSTKIKKS